MLTEVPPYVRPTWCPAVSGGERAGESVIRLSLGKLLVNLCSCYAVSRYWSPEIWRFVHYYGVLYHMSRRNLLYASAVCAASSLRGNRDDNIRRGL